MTSEWRRVKISEIIEIIGGGTPKTSVPEYWNGDIPWLSVADFNNVPRWVTSTEKHITKRGLEESSTKLLSAGDIIISARGTVGAIAQLTRPMTFNQSCYGIRGVEGISNTDFVFYALKFVVEQLKRLAHGAVFDTITRDTFDTVNVLLPSLNEQNQIASLLGALDDRITLLRETNQTLEAIAQALFKSWFVDFDPVRAKSEGRLPDGIDAAAAALFPDAFEESELGIVPRGWLVSRIGDISAVIDCLHSKKPELIESEFPFLQLSNIRDDGLLDTSELKGVSESDYIKWTSRIEVSGGDCVITNVGRVGAVAQIPEGFKAAMGRNMTAIRLSSHWPYPTYLIELLQSSWMQTEINAKTDVGTILNALNVKSIPQLRCVVADSFVMSTFESIARPLRNAMEKNLFTVHTLSNLRDTLLPRLISGQLRIADAEKELVKASA